MKKINLLQCLCYASMALMVSCTSEELVQENEEAKGIVMTVQDFQYESDSRTSIEMSAQGGQFTWSDNDTVGIFSNIEGGRQVDFPMAKGAGTNQAYFNGGGWALKSNTQYSAYYPLNGQFYLDKTQIPLVFKGQEQSGNDSSAHLGQFDYLAAVATTPQNGNVNFNFQHLGCLVRLNFTMPQDGELTQVVLSSKEAIFARTGTVDLTANPLAITPGNMAGTLAVQVKNLTAKANDDVKIYLMMAPVDLTGKTVNVSLTIGGKSVMCDGTLSQKNLMAGKAYRLSLQ